VSLDKALYDDYLLDGFEQATNSIVRNQRNNWKTRKRTTPKRVKIRQKYNATVVLSRQEDKDGTNKQTI